MKPELANQTSPLVSVDLQRFVRPSDSGPNSHCETPADIFMALDKEFGFDLDVCANPKTAKCKKWYGWQDNGLEQIWTGKVWCNPPFDKTKAAWVRKAWEASEQGATVVVMLPWNGTGDTGWWHDYALRAAEVRYLRGRQTFKRPAGKVTLRTVLLVFKPRWRGPTVAMSWPNPSSPIHADGGREHGRKTMNNQDQTTSQRGADSVQRLVRPDPRTFTNFPADSKCPICGTNDDGKTVLVQIAGTASDGIAKAKPMHLACAIAKQWDEGMGIALTWPNDKVSRP